MDFYVKCGDVDSATDEPNDVSWSAMHIFKMSSCTQAFADGSQAHGDAIKRGLVSYA